MRKGRRRGEALYEVRVDLACFRFCSGTQESSLAEYPFYRIRKEQEDGVQRWRMIFSISYSSSLLIRSGGVQGSSGHGPRFHDKAIREKYGRLGGSSRSLVSRVGKQ